MPPQPRKFLQNFTPLRHLLEELMSDATKSSPRGVVRAEAKLRLRTSQCEQTCDRRRPVVRFGRAQENEIVVDGEFASRHHGEVKYEKGRFYLTDYSKNGTLVVRRNHNPVQIRQKTVRLEGAGALRCGNIDAVEIAFEIETRGARASSRSGATPAKQRPADAYLFRLEGEYWTIAYDGRAVRLKDSKGLRYVHHLVRNPGKEFHALDLAAVESDAAPARFRERHGARTGWQGAGAGPALDTLARNAYRRQLRELRDELAEAERFHDLERAGRLREEIELIGGELAAAFGLGGKQRLQASNAERARIAVTLRIKEALSKIRTCDPELGLHLTTCITTGKFCSYEPGPTRRISWRF